MRINAINAVASAVTRVNFGNFSNKRTTSPNNISFSADDYGALYAHHPTLRKYTKNFNALFLLDETNKLNLNSQKYDSAINHIQNVGFEKLTQQETLKPIDNPHPVLWSVTSEFAPVKEGGLGSVPPEIRNNAEKLGVSVPTFVPMYLNQGSSTFNEIEGKPVFKRGNKEFELEHVATIKMDTYKDGVSSTIPVDLYLHEDEQGQLIFVKADKYFDGTIYEANNKTEEPEKFAVFSKAVYEFAKLKTQGADALKDVVIHSKSALDEIGSPDGMILNDWQASPVAALMRYKAPMENAYNQINDETAQKLRDMRIITIGHNCRYQGSTKKQESEPRRSATGNILNTLFDKFTYDIVSNAFSGASKLTKNQDIIKKNENVLVMNSQALSQNSTNFLNMGVVLSDVFNPVSQNYAQEVISPNHPELAHDLQWIIQQKASAGKVIGVINGNDFKNLSVEAKQAQIKKGTGIDFKMYSKTSTPEELKQARLYNKIHLYNDFIVPFSDSEDSSSDETEKVKQFNPNLEFYHGIQETGLRKIDEETLKNTPIFMSGGRLAGQKGVDILCDSLEMLYNNWDKDFKGKEKPIVYIAGMDAEGGKQRAMIEELKNEKLSPEDSSRIIFLHGFAPMTAMMAGADFFLMPSKFEPCGLTQGESMATATPVIASAVGGIVDTVNRNGLHNGILTDKDEALTAEGFYEATKEGLNIFFNDKNHYEQMTQDSLKEDFSWIQKDGKGPVFEYLELFGIKGDDLQKTNHKKGLARVFNLN